MAELAGLYLAAPGVLATLYTFGTGILDRLEGVRDYDKNLNRYRQVGINLSTGLIKTQVQLVIGAIHDNLISEDLKQGLDQSFRDLIQAITDVDKELQKSLKLPFTGKLKILMLGENIKLTNRLKMVEQHQLLFERYSNYVNLFRSTPVPYKLDSRKFSVKGEHDTHLPGERLRTSDVFSCSGVLSKNGNVETVEIILEEKFYSPRLQQQAEEDVRILVSRLQLAQQLSGVPSCLGYRQSPADDKFELIFQLPKNCAIRSLADLLAFNDAPPLEERVALCQMLASSVSDIHGLNLVHKNIRPRSILVVSPTADDRPKAVLLTDWTLVREENEASRWRGEDKWDRAIYQHPTRQGSLAEKHYTFTHDIYSLGVCMVEILLWKSLIVTPVEPNSNGQYSFSEIFQSRALKLAEGTTIPARHLQVPERLARYPKFVSAVIADLARVDLPSLTGSRISNVVIKALGDAQESGAQSEPVDAGVEYLRDVLLVLDSVSI